jgi:hypothetical protein
MASRTLKEILNSVLGQSAFLQRDSFASGTDVDDIQMVEFANRAAHEIRTSFPWNMLRESHQVTLQTGVLEYDLPADFDWYLSETMWKSQGARHVVIPTSDRYWAYIKAGNPGTRINYYAKFINGKLVFTSVDAGDVINFDYISENAIMDSAMQPKDRFTEDTDTFLLDDSTLVRGTQAYWKTEKEMPTGALDMQNFRKDLLRDIGQDTPAKVIRMRDNGMYTPNTPPISTDYLW